MKSRLAVLFVLACGGTAGVLGVPNAYAQEKCTKARLRGSYGHLITGTRFEPRALVTNVGMAHFDGKGQVVLDVTLALNGKIMSRIGQPDPPRPYTVNEDCTGIVYRTDGTPTWEIIITNDGREILWNFVGGDRSTNGIAQKQDEKGCTEASLEGNYGRLSTGTRFDLGGALAVNHGTIVFDGKGHYSLPIDTLTIDGVVSRYTGGSGTYRVNENCSGTIYNEGGAESSDIVIVDGAREILYVSIEGDRSVTGVSKRE